MEIIVGYGTSPLMERIIRHLWDHLSMVAREGLYYGTPFKGHQQVTQVGDLYPTIFNMVFDAVISHWFILVVEEEVGPDGFERAVQWLAAFFYSNDRLIASTKPARIQ